MRMDLPEILDSHENFCTIEIESKALGKTFFTNASTDVADNDLMSYSNYTNAITFNLPSERLQEFKG